MAPQVASRLNWVQQAVSPWIQRWLAADLGPKVADRESGRQPRPETLAGGSVRSQSLDFGPLTTGAMTTLARVQRFERLAQSVAQRFPAPRRNDPVLRRTNVDRPALTLAGETEPAQTSEPGTDWLEAMPSFDEVRRRFEAGRQPSQPGDTKPVGQKPPVPPAVQRSSTGSEADWLEAMPSFDEVRRRYEAGKAQTVTSGAAASTQAEAKPSSIQRRTASPPRMPGQALRRRPAGGRRVVSRVQEVTPGKPAGSQVSPTDPPEQALQAPNLPAPVEPTQPATASEFSDVASTEPAPFTQPTRQENERPALKPDQAPDRPPAIPPGADASGAGQRAALEPSGAETSEAPPGKTLPEEAAELALPRSDVEMPTTQAVTPSSQPSQSLPAPAELSHPTVAPAGPAPSSQPTALPDDAHSIAQPMADDLATSKRADVIDQPPVPPPALQPGPSIQQAAAAPHSGKTAEALSGADVESPFTKEETPGSTAPRETLQRAAATTPRSELQPPALQRQSHPDSFWTETLPSETTAKLAGETGLAQDEEPPGAASPELQEPDSDNALSYDERENMGEAIPRVTQPATLSSSESTTTSGPADSGLAQPEQLELIQRRPAEPERSAVESPGKPARAEGEAAMLADEPPTSAAHSLLPSLVPQTTAPPSTSDPGFDLSQAVIGRVEAARRLPTLTPEALSTQPRTQLQAVVQRVAHRSSSNQPDTNRPAEAPLPLAAPRLSQGRLRPDSSLTPPPIVSAAMASAAGELIQRQWPANPIAAPPIEPESSPDPSVVQREPVAAPPVELEATTPPAAESSNLEDLARQVYPLVKRLLAVERERGAVR